MAYCSKCNGETKFLKGIGKKSGKPYQGFKCLDPVCDNMDFIPDEAMVTKEVREVPSPIKPKANGTNADMRLSYRKDLMCSVLDNYSSDGTAPINVVIEMFKLAWEEVEK